MVPHPWQKRGKGQGYSELGWHHFTGRHNIKKCSTLDKALRDHVDRDDHHGHLRYDGFVIETGPRPRQVKFTVIVQNTRKTTDGHYDAGPGQKIGVITRTARDGR
ncbi:hypothetical protein [Streptomyces sp. NPDC021608]|uniref:hypothetical protein n=1 Tax=Streptomyces sp. NPDC021608 TaxID=3154903 RepID=UPI0034088235